MDNNGGIGKNNQLPWSYNKEDMRQFMLKTTGNGNNSIIMGYNTFKSICEKPLPNRMNFVLTTKIINNDKYTNLIFVSSIEELISKTLQMNYDENWIIGGQSIYNEFIKNYHQWIQEIHVTRINKSYVCDTFFDINQVKTKFILYSSNIDPKYEYNVYEIYHKKIII